MKVTDKLFASLSNYLPLGATDNSTYLEVAKGVTREQIITQLGVPHEHCHLVLTNGEYVSPGERQVCALREDDALAIWPPIAGG
jgi:sulfur carrier protein ThiS